MFLLLYIVPVEMTVVVFILNLLQTLRPHTCPSEVNLIDIIMVVLLLCFRQASSDVSGQISHSVHVFGLQMGKFRNLTAK